MVSEIARKLWKTPSLGKEVYSLSDGDPSRPMIDDENLDKIDLARIRDIIRCNSFCMNPHDAGMRGAWKELLPLLPDAQQCTSSILEDTGPEFGGGIWIKESMLNNSCTPNCTWTNIGDQIFVRTTKPIQKGEELCIPYASLKISYEERWEKFSRWIRPGVGFECLCDHCNLLRSRRDLRQLTMEIDKILELGDLENPFNARRIPKGRVGKSVFPHSLRRAIFSPFAQLPLRLQHTRVAELHELEGRILATEEGDLDGALKAYQLATKIYYEVRGSDGWSYFVQHWRVAGLAIACRQCDLARESLENIWNSTAFQAYPKKEAKLMFQDITRDYVTRMIPQVDAHYMTEIEARIGPLIHLVLNQ